MLNPGGCFFFGAFHLRHLRHRKSELFESFPTFEILKKTACLVQLALIFLEGLQPLLKSNFIEVPMIGESLRGVQTRGSELFCLILGCRKKLGNGDPN